MTPTQLLKIKGEFEEKFAPLIDWETGNHSDKVWQWFESKLEEVEEEEKINDKPSWRCGKCEQEEMRSKGIAIICPIPEHSIRCSLRKSNKLEDGCDHRKIGVESTLKFGICTVCNKRIF